MIKIIDSDYRHGFGYGLSKWISENVSANTSLAAVEKGMRILISAAPSGIMTNWLDGGKTTLIGLTVPLYFNQIKRGMQRMY